MTGVRIAVIYAKIGATRGSTVGGAIAAKTSVTGAKIVETAGKTDGIGATSDE